MREEGGAKRGGQKEKEGNGSRGEKEMERRKRTSRKKVLKIRGGMERGVKGGRNARSVRGGLWGGEDAGEGAM